MRAASPAVTLPSASFWKVKRTKRGRSFALRITFRMTRLRCYSNARSVWCRSRCEQSGFGLRAMAMHSLNRPRLRYPLNLDVRLPTFEWEEIC